MTRLQKIQYFDAEGRGNLTAVIRSVKAYYKQLKTQGLTAPRKLVVLTTRGEGPVLAYTNLKSDEVQIIAVTFPVTYFQATKESINPSQIIPDTVRSFFAAVGIPIITNRLPFDPIEGAEGHNRDMRLLKDSLSLFCGSAPLAVQAVIQAVDSGHVLTGEQVIAITGDTAIVVTAAGSQSFLRRDETGLSINEIICKPRLLTRTKPVASRPRLENEASAVPGAPVHDALS